MAEKLSKKEIEQPDWFQTELARATDFIAHHRKQIAWGAGIFLLLFICAAGLYYYDVTYEREAGELYIKALQGEGGADAAAQEKKMIAALAEVTAKYPRSDAAVTVHYRLGNMYYRQGDIDRAILSFRELLKRAPAGSEFMALAHSGLGYCYEAKKDYPQALAAFQEAVNSPAGWAFAATEYGNVARMFEEMKEPVKAVEFYRKALDKSSDPGVKLVLTRKIAMLGDLPRGK